MVTSSWRRVQPRNDASDAASEGALRSAPDTLRSMRSSIWATCGCPTGTGFSSWNRRTSRAKAASDAKVTTAAAIATGEPTGKRSIASVHRSLRDLQTTGPETRFNERADQVRGVPGAHVAKSPPENLHRDLDVVGTRRSEEL